jgi:hypothetical protein
MLCSPPNHRAALNLNSVVSAMSLRLGRLGFKAGSGAERMLYWGPLIPKVCTHEECLRWRHILNNMYPLETCSSGGPQWRMSPLETLSGKVPSTACVPQVCTFVKNEINVR